MADLSTSYMGLELRNPVIVSSSDLTKTVSGIKKCEDAGAGAVVLKSIFEEQFLIDGDIPKSEYAIHPEALDYMRSGSLLEYAPLQLTRMIEEAKQRVEIPIIASINCQTSKLWPRFARQIQDAGADALELNVSFHPVSLSIPSAEYEDHHLEILKAVKSAVSVPISVKLKSQFTSVSHLGQQLAEAGCNAIVLFNWFLEPDIDVETLKTRSRIGKANFFHSLRWIGLLSGRVECDVASSGGVRTAEDVVKQILAGAAGVQVCTLFYQKGLDEIKQLLGGLEDWMDRHGYKSIDDFQGELSFRHQELLFKDIGEASAYFRAQYLKAYATK
jgi:dihydroorotate dehydrogenase (fumarate)